MAGAGRRRPRSQHFLLAHVARELVAGAGVGPADLVVEVGAGTGVLTLALARTGARVVAIELDERLARRARRRVADFPHVRVVARDFFDCGLPRRSFRVVANLPFAGSTAVIRRLLDPRIQLRRADLVLEWGAALKWERGDRRWAAGHDMRIVRRLPASSFAPAPPVDAAVLVVVPHRRNRVGTVAGHR